MILSFIKKFYIPLKFKYLYFAAGTCPCLRSSYGTTVTCTNSNKPSSRCTFRCDRSYKLYPRDSKVLTCLSTGFWDKKEPVCSGQC